MSTPPPAELLVGARRPSRWRARWRALPRIGRVLVVLTATGVLVVAGLPWYRDWSAERELRQRVVLTTSLAVWASATWRPDGELGYFLLVRNEGLLPLTVTAVEGVGDGVRLRMLGEAQPLAPGAETGIPLSVRLTCGDLTGAATSVPAEVTVRRADGARVLRRVDLQPATAVSDVVRVLCRIDPGLADHELSGPALRLGE